MNCKKENNSNHICTEYHVTGTLLEPIYWHDVGSFRTRQYLVRYDNSNSNCIYLCYYIQH